MNNKALSSLEKWKRPAVPKPLCAGPSPEWTPSWSSAPSPSQPSMRAWQPLSQQQIFNNKKVPGMTSNLKFGQIDEDNLLIKYIWVFNVYQHNQTSFNCLIPTQLSSTWYATLFQNGHGQKKGKGGGKKNVLEKRVVPLKFGFFGGNHLSLCSWYSGGENVFIVNNETKGTRSGVLLERPTLMWAGSSGFRQLVTKLSKSFCSLTN